MEKQEGGEYQRWLAGPEAAGISEEPAAPVLGTVVAEVFFAAAAAGAAAQVAWAFQT